MKVFNFLNGSVRDYCPDGQSDTWGNYNNPDTLKLAAVAMRSWQLNGWESIRYGSGSGSENGFTRYQFAAFKSAILRESVAKGYGKLFWDNWFSMAEIFESTRERWNWFTTNDVINSYFTPFAALKLQCEAERMGKTMINLERGRLSNAAFGCRLNYILDVIKTIELVDDGRLLPDTTIQLVSDESIARDFLSENCLFAELMSIGVYSTDSLTHISRSALQQIDDVYPYVP